MTSEEIKGMLCGRRGDAPEEELQAILFASTTRHARQTVERSLGPDRKKHMARTGRTAFSPRFG
jgi:hypothetical protein